MTSGKGKGGKRLSTEDKAIWRKVAETVEPLKTTVPLEFDLEIEPEATAVAGAKASKDPVTELAGQAKPEAKGPKPLVPLERRTRQKVVRGTRRIDARIDLHGMTQHQAHDHLRAFLHRAQGNGCSIVLVITGKGTRDSVSAYMDERGILRRVVPQWLSMADLRGIVLGYEEAHLTHGGTGALYVRLRKLKDV